MVYEKQSDGTFRIESVPFSNGRFVASHTSAGTSFDAQRHLTDHLGSIRCIVNSGGLVIEQNDYTPFGLRFNIPSYPRSSNRYLFNGKEEIFAGLLDYGARIYDPVTRRWLTQDPLADKYYSISPYVYCANNPVNAIDPDGKLVIFINGMHIGDGGTPKYWGGFDTAVMKHLNDPHAMYRDGSRGGTLNMFNNGNIQKRQNWGYERGLADAAYILNRITDKNGNITETIKIITHSMGSAYAKGYIKALLKRGIDPSMIEFEADFAPYQAWAQSAVNGIPTFQFSHRKDLIAHPIYMSDAEWIDTSDDKSQTHKILSFIEQIKKLPKGIPYKPDGNTLVPF